MIVSPSTPLADCGGFLAGETLAGYTGRAWPLPNIQLYTSLGSLCGSFLSGETCCGSPGDVYDLPATMIVPEDTQAGRFRSVARLLVDGEAHDGWQVDARNFDVSGSVCADDPWPLRIVAGEIAERSATPGLRLRHEQGPRAGCLRLSRLKDVERKFLDLSGRCYVDFKLRWRLSDPTWHEQRYRCAIFQLDVGTCNFDFDAGATHLSHPTLRIIAPAGGAVGNLRLVNWRDDRRWLTYSDGNYLRNGNFVTIDSELGTATRGDGSNALHYMGGTFLRLRSGFNKFAYTGGPCTLIFTWIVRSL